MSMTIGNKLKLSIFGESHGPVIGGVIDGILPGIKLDMHYINNQMKRRMPGQNEISTERQENDIPTILSGVFNQVTTGTPLAFIIHNNDYRSEDYEKNKNLIRPGHADYTSYIKYNTHADYRGGGHFSGRLTASIMFAGAIASLILERANIYCISHILSIKDIVDDSFDLSNTNIDIIDRLRASLIPTINEDKSILMKDCILQAKEKGDSVGGVVQCMVTGMPAGIGSPFFDSVESKLSHMMFSIPAVKGIEFGKGFEITKLYGSMANDVMAIENGAITHKSNNNGGILGGITNAMPILFDVAIKPTASISINQDTIDIEKGINTSLVVTGRHDPCIVPRVSPVIEAATAFVVLDLILDEQPQYIKNRYSI